MPPVGWLIVTFSVLDLENDPAEINCTCCNQHSSIYLSCSQTGADLLVMDISTDLILIIELLQICIPS